MKYNDRDALVEDLREMADLIEKVGLNLPIEMYYPYSISQYFYADENAREKLVRAAKALGSAKKDFVGDYFHLDRVMKNGKMKLHFEAKREAVCTRKVVGTTEEPKRVYVEIPGETVTKEIVEWECDEPLLKG